MFLRYLISHSFDLTYLIQLSVKICAARSQTTENKHLRTVGRPSLEMYNFSYVHFQINQIKVLTLHKKRKRVIVQGRRTKPADRNCARSSISGTSNDIINVGDVWFCEFRYQIEVPTLHKMRKRVVVQGRRTKPKDPKWASQVDRAFLILGNLTCK